MATNVNAPRGLVPVNGAYSQPYNAGVRQYVHSAGDSQAIFVGDLVTATGATELVNLGGTVQSFPVVAQSATGDVFQGVCVGVLALTRDSAIFGAASTQTILFVCDDPNALFWVQDVNSGTPLAPDDVELNINILVNQGSTVTGMSGMVLNNGTEAVTNTLDLKILGQYQSPDNDLGSDASTGTLAGKYLVKINRHRFANQVAGI